MYLHEISQYTSVGPPIPGPPPQPPSKAHHNKHKMHNGYHHVHLQQRPPQQQQQQHAPAQPTPPGPPHLNHQYYIPHNNRQQIAKLSRPMQHHQIPKVLTANRIYNPSPQSIKQYHSSHQHQLQQQQPQQQQPLQNHQYYHDFDRKHKNINLNSSSSESSDSTINVRLVVPPIVTKKLAYQSFLSQNNHHNDKQQVIYQHQPPQQVNVTKLYEDSIESLEPLSTKSYITNKDKRKSESVTLNKSQNVSIAKSFGESIEKSLSFDENLLNSNQKTKVLTSLLKSLSSTLSKSALSIITDVHPKIELANLESIEPKETPKETIIEGYKHKIESPRKVSTKKPLSMRTASSPQRQKSKISLKKPELSTLSSLTKSGTDSLMDIYETNLRVINESKNKRYSQQTNSNYPSIEPAINSSKTPLCTSVGLSEISVLSSIHPTSHSIESLKSQKSSHLRLDSQKNREKTAPSILLRNRFIEKNREALESNKFIQENKQENKNTSIETYLSEPILSEKEVSEIKDTKESRAQVPISPIVTKLLTNESTRSTPSLKSEDYETIMRIQNELLNSFDRFLQQNDDYVSLSQTTTLTMDSEKKIIQLCQIKNESKAIFNESVFEFDEPIMEKSTSSDKQLEIQEKENESPKIEKISNPSNPIIKPVKTSLQPKKIKKNSSLRKKGKKSLGSDEKLKKTLRAKNKASILAKGTKSISKKKTILDKTKPKKDIKQIQKPVEKSPKITNIDKEETPVGSPLYNLPPPPPEFASNYDLIDKSPTLNIHLYLPHDNSDDTFELPEVPSKSLGKSSLELEMEKLSLEMFIQSEKLAGCIENAKSFSHTKQDSLSVEELRLKVEEEAIQNEPKTKTTNSETFNDKIEKLEKLFENQEVSKTKTSQERVDALMDTENTLVEKQGIKNKTKNEQVKQVRSKPLVVVRKNSPLRRNLSEEFNKQVEAIDNEVYKESNNFSEKNKRQKEALKIEKAKKEKRKEQYGVPVIEVSSKNRSNNIDQTSLKQKSPSYLKNPITSQKPFQNKKQSSQKLRLLQKSFVSPERRKNNKKEKLRISPSLERVSETDETQNSSFENSLKIEIKPTEEPKLLEPQIISEEKIEIKTQKEEKPVPKVDDKLKEAKNLNMNSFKATKIDKSSSVKNLPKKVIDYNKRQSRSTEQMKVPDVKPVKKIISTSSNDKNKLNIKKSEPVKKTTTPIGLKSQATRSSISFNSSVKLSNESTNNKLAKSASNTKFELRKRPSQIIASTQKPKNPLNKSLSTSGVNLKKQNSKIELKKNPITTNNKKPDQKSRLLEKSVSSSAVNNKGKKTILSTDSKRVPSKINKSASVTTIPKRQVEPKKPANKRDSLKSASASSFTKKMINQNKDNQLRSGSKSKLLSPSQIKAGYFSRSNSSTSLKGSFETLATSTPKGSTQNLSTKTSIENLKENSSLISSASSSTSKIHDELIESIQAKINQISSVEFDSPNLYSKSSSLLNKLNNKGSSLVNLTSEFDQQEQQVQNRKASTPVNEISIQQNDSSITLQISPINNIKPQNNSLVNDNELNQFKRDHEKSMGFALSIESQKPNFHPNRNFQGFRPPSKRSIYSRYGPNYDAYSSNRRSQPLNFFNLPPSPSMQSQKKSIGRPPSLSDGRKPISTSFIPFTNSTYRFSLHPNDPFTSMESPVETLQDEYHPPCELPFKLFSQMDTSHSYQTLPIYDESNKTYNSSQFLESENYSTLSSHDVFNTAGTSLSFFNDCVRPLAANTKLLNSSETNPLSPSDSDSVVSLEDSMLIKDLSKVDLASERINDKPRILNGPKIMQTNEINKSKSQKYNSQQAHLQQMHTLISSSSSNKKQSFQPHKPFLQQLQSNGNNKIPQSVNTLIQTSNQQQHLQKSKNEMQILLKSKGGTIITPPSIFAASKF